MQFIAVNNNKKTLTAPDEVCVVFVGVLLAMVFVDPCCNTVLTTVWGAYIMNKLYICTHIHIERYKKSKSFTL